MTRLLFLARAGALMVVGCGPTFQAGFPNVPSANRQSQPQNAHDVITNGAESCGGAAGAKNEDPLRYRVPPCRSEEQHASFSTADGGAN